MPISRSRIGSPEVAAVFAGWPEPIRERALELRALIVEVAASIPEVGALEEALRWGEPSYLTSQSRAGTTIRIGWKAASPSQYCLLFHCQTSLVESFRDQYRHELRFAGNRAIVLDEHQDLPRAALRECIAAALTYHLTRGRR